MEEIQNNNQQDSTIQPIIEPDKPKRPRGRPRTKPILTDDQKIQRQKEVRDIRVKNLERGRKTALDNRRKKKESARKELLFERDLVEKQKRKIIKESKIKTVVPTPQVLTPIKITQVSEKAKSDVVVPEKTIFRKRRGNVRGNNRKNKLY